GSDKHIILIYRYIGFRIPIHHPWRPVVCFSGRINNQIYLYIWLFNLFKS
ncbi:hypothetical protein BHE74_00032648, partial [Ensete ventricosum]